MLDEEFDPDELLGFVHAYAGQVALVDMCLGMLLAALDEHPLAGETLLVVTSPRGYPLGEHRRVGPCDEALYGELLHVPLLVRFPGGDRRARCGRSESCSRTSSIRDHRRDCSWRQTTLAAASRDGEPTTCADAACASGLSSERFARPPGSCASRSGRRSAAVRAVCQARRPLGSQRSLVALRRRGRAAEQRELDRFEAAARDGRLAELPPLAEILCDVWR